MVFVLVLARLGWRTGEPDTAPARAPEDLGSGRPPGFTHAGLYVLLLAQPLVGWVMSSASPLGIPTKIFGVLPPARPGCPRTRALFDVLVWVHFGIAMTILALVALHVAAALKPPFPC